MVEGVECLITANDPTVKGGASNPWTVKKGFRAAQIAAENGLPTISLVESGGADLPTQKEIFIPGGKVFRDLTRSSAAKQPTIALVFGNSTAGGAYVPGMSDYTVFVRGAAKVFLGGPPLVKMATGEESDDESLGGAEMHARTSGLADYLAEDEHDAIRIGRRIVARLNWRKAPAALVSTRPGGPSTSGPHLRGARADPEGLLDLIPQDLKEPFDPREVIARIVDGRSESNGAVFDEFKPLYGTSLVTGWAQLHGQPDRHPRQRAGRAVQRGGAEGDPVHPAGQPGRRAPAVPAQHHRLHGRQGVRAGRHHQARRADDQRRQQLAHVPHLSVVMGASYGAGNYGMNGRAFDPRFLFTWPSAKSAVMGPAQLAGVLEIVARQSAESKGNVFDADGFAGVKQLVETQIEEQSLPYVLSGMLYDDGVIDPRDTRTVLAICLSVIENRPIVGTDRFGVFR